MRKSTRIAIALFLTVAFTMSFAMPLSFAAAAPVVSAGAPGLGFVPSKADPSRKLNTAKYGLSSMPLAASRDLTVNAPPIGNQGQYQSCVGFAMGYYYMTWLEKQKHNAWDISQKQYDYSPQYVWNGINGGGDNATSIYDALSYMESNGCTDWDEFPYDGASYAVQPNAQDIEAAKQYRISNDWSYFFIQRDKGPDVITPLKAQLNSGQPFVLAIPVYSDFPDYGGNPDTTYYDHYGGSLLGGHALFVAGYNDNAGGTGRGGFLVLNSWGGSWNGNGRVYLSYDFIQTYAYEAWRMTAMDSTPSLTSFMPANGGSGQLVTANGNNLGAWRRNAKVTFAGGRTGQIVNWANDQIKVRVPSGARTGSAYVYDWDGVASNPKVFTVGAASNAGANWLLAEGATWPGMDEYILLQNPNTADSNVKVAFITPKGEGGGTVVTVPAKSRTTLHVNDYVPNSDVSAAITVTSGATICAERSMYFSTSDGKWGSHDSVAAGGVSQYWYLAEGATWPGMDEWILVMNPFNNAVTAKVTFETPGGEVAGPTLNLGANTRQSVHVNDLLRNQDVAAKVECTTPGYGIVAERSMYMNTPDGKVDCHNSIGATEAAPAWGLAEGATWPGYEEWVLVQNPTAASATVDMYFLTPTDVVRGPTEAIAPGRRISVRVNDYVSDQDVSTMVFTKSDTEAVVVERSMYIAANAQRRGAHNSPGSIYSSKDWLLPEGCTSPGFDEWVLVMNPDTKATANVTLTFMTSHGQVQGPAAQVPPASRKTFHVNDYVSGDVSTRVLSDNYVIAERAMYMNTPQGKAGATDSLGVPAAMLGQSGSGPAPAVQRLQRSW